MTSADLTSDRALTLEAMEAMEARVEFTFRRMLAASTHARRTRWGMLFLKAIEERNSQPGWMQRRERELGL